MAIEARKMKSYLESQKMKKQSMMPNVLKKAGLPIDDKQHVDIEIEYEAGEGKDSEHAEEAMKSAHKGGIGKPMPAAKGKGSAKEAEQAMKAMAALIAEELDEGECDDDIMMLMADFDPESMPDWVLDEKVWKKATKIVDPEGDGAEFSDPYSVIAHLYKKMGGKFKEMDEEYSEEEYEDEGELADEEA